MDDVSSMTFELNESHLSWWFERYFTLLLPPIQIGDDPNLTWAYLFFECVETQPPTRNVSFEAWTSLAEPMAILLGAGEAPRLISSLELVSEMIR